MRNTIIVSTIYAIAAASIAWIGNVDPNHPSIYRHIGGSIVAAVTVFAINFALTVAIQSRTRRKRQELNHE